jgi:CRP/FNR family transcriptional regulator, cyclic AMP receptor protein
MSEESSDIGARIRLEALAQRGTVRNYRKGSILIQEGGVDNTLFIVLKGRLKAFSKGNDENGRDVTYGVYGQGDFVGEMSFDGGTRSASVMAIESSTCSVVTRATVKSFICDEPEFAFDLLSRVIVRARKATTSTRSLALTNAYGRLTELLVSEAEQMPDGSMAIATTLSHRDIASRIGCSREMVSRLMKDLKTGDYIVIDAKKRLVIRKSLPSRW